MDAGVGGIVSTMLCDDVYLDQGISGVPKDREYGSVGMRRNELSIVLAYIIGNDPTSLQASESNESITMAAHHYL